MILRLNNIGPGGTQTLAGEGTRTRAGGPGPGLGGIRTRAGGDLGRVYVYATGRPGDSLFRSTLVAKSENFDACF